MLNIFSTYCGIIESRDSLTYEVDIGSKDGGNIRGCFLISRSAVQFHPRAPLNTMDYVLERRPFLVLASTVASISTLFYASKLVQYQRPLSANSGHSANEVLFNEFCSSSEFILTDL